ncbi:transcriptional regulator [Bifidobacterium longum]|nr:transcriptional regulator [Bifidobacterium longum]MDB6679977.1 transcriptional regulator [Bifidobacterium longum]MDB6784417.1 transcriptional regulator [Bifidobacterium longum]MDB6792715.1 transcriptional regulator [Bifidobacterium longum]
MPTLTPTPACPQLTTVRQPMDAFGVSLATLVLDQIEDRLFQRTGLLPTEVVAR